MIRKHAIQYFKSNLYTCTVFVFTKKQHTSKMKADRFYIKLGKSNNKTITY